MYQNQDTLSLLSNIASKLRLYATAVIKEGTEQEILRLLTHYPELLYHQYNELGYWNDFAWNFLYKITNKKKQYSNDFLYEIEDNESQLSDNILISRIKILKKLNYIPSGMFRERLMASNNILLIKEYIKLFENDTSKKYVLPNGEEFSSLINLFTTFNKEEKKDNKKIMSMLIANVTDKINEKDKYGFAVQNILVNTVFVNNPVMVFVLIEKGMSLNVVIEDRNKIAIEYIKSINKEKEIKPHSIFKNQECVELPLIQSWLFSFAKDQIYYNGIHNNELKLFKKLLPRIRKERPELEKENESILKYLNIDSLNDVYFNTDSK